MTDLEELERLLAKATPGPWGIWFEQINGQADKAIQELIEQVHATDPIGNSLVMLDAEGKCPAITGCGPTSADNAALIVALHNAAPSLIATAREVERLRVENERLRRDLVDTKAEYHRVSEVALDLSREADELRAEIARLMELVEEAGEMLVMFLRHKTSTGDDCFTFRLTTEHIRWAEAALVKIKETPNAG